MRNVLRLGKDVKAGRARVKELMKLRVAIQMELGILEKEIVAA